MAVYASVVVQANVVKAGSSVPSGSVVVPTSGQLWPRGA